MMDQKMMDQKMMDQKMMDHLPLVDVANTLATAIEKLNDYYDVEALELRFPNGKPSSEQGQLLNSALEAVLQLQRMLLGPLGSIMSLSGQLFDLAVLHTLYDSEVAQNVPMAGTIPISKLAITAGIPEMHLRRLLRHAATNRIFTEPTPGAIAHTLISRRLAQDPLMRATVSMLVDEMFPAAACLSPAMRKYGNSQKATDTAWAIANSAQRPMVDELEAVHPERAAQFAAFMRFNWSQQQPLQPLIDNFDWASLGEAHVVDIGGGMGHTSIALAEAFPELTFTVQDFKKVVENGEQLLLEAAKTHEGLKERITFMAHDAFNNQPVKAARVYLFRSVFHDWPDESCIAILQRLVPALEQGATVLINDFVMPGPGELSLIEDRRARSLDLTMTSLFNARDREVHEWEPLFAYADARFQFKGVRAPRNKKLMSVIEATWTGSSIKQ